MDDILAFIGRERVIVVYPTDGQRGWIEKVLDAATAHLLAAAADCVDWPPPLLTAPADAPQPLVGHEIA